MGMPYWISLILLIPGALFVLASGWVLYHVFSALFGFDDRWSL